MAREVRAQPPYKGEGRARRLFSNVYEMAVPFLSKIASIHDTVPVQRWGPGRTLRGRRLASPRHGSLEFLQGASGLQEYSPGRACFLTPVPWFVTRVHTLKQDDEDRLRLQNVPTVCSARPAALDRRPFCSPIWGFSARTEMIRMMLRDRFTQKKEKAARWASPRGMLLAIIALLFVLGAASTTVFGVQPDPPENMTAAPLGAGEIHITWDPPTAGDPVDEYLLWGSDQETINFVELAVIPDGQPLEFTETGLGPNKLRYYEVQAVNIDGSSVAAAANAVTHDVPGAPTGLTATAGAGAGEIDLAWTAPLDDGGMAITEYRVSRGTTMDNLIQVTTVTAPATTYADSGLNNNQEYFYEVTAVSDAGEGAASNMDSATTHDVPGAPTGLSADPSGVKEITLDWTAPLENGGTAITHYEIHRGTATGATAKIADTPDATTGYIDNVGLLNGTQYFYDVKAVNVVGPGLASDEDSATTHDVPSAPTLATPTREGVGELKLEWIPPFSDGGSAVTGYRVYAGPDADSLTFLAATVNTEYLHTGLGDGETWFYAVSAENAVGEGAQSGAQSQMTKDVPGPPGGPFTATGGSGEVHLEWTQTLNDGGSAILHYNVYGGDDADTLVLLGTVDPAGPLEYTETGLANGQTRHYEVTAENEVGEGSAFTASATTNTPSGGGGGGGGGWSRASADTTVRAIHSTSDVDRAYRAGPTSFAQDGVWTISFPNSEGRFESIEIHFARELKQVVLDIEILADADYSHDGLTGFSALDQMRIELRDLDGPLTHDDVTFSIVAIPVDQESLDGRTAQSLTFSRWDPAADSWAPADSFVSEDGSMLYVGLPGFSRFALLFDDAPPEVSLESDTAWNGIDALEVTASDNRGVASVEMTLNGEPVEVLFDNGTATFTPDETLTAGTYTLSVMATDRSGLSTTEVYTLDVAEADETATAGEDSADEESVDSPMPGIVVVVLAVFAGLAVRRAAKRRA